MHKQMVTSLLVLASLLLLLLAERTHGIRLDRQLHEAIDNKEMGGSMAGQSFHTATWTNKHCTSYGHCSGKARMTLAHAEAKQQAQQHQSPERSNDATPPPQNRDEAEANRGGAKEQEAAAAAAPRQPQEKTTSTTYPDIFDISGMDYSPATRKPPIHN